MTNAISILDNIMSLQIKNVKYWYGAKGQLATIELANMLRKNNPSVWNDYYYNKAISMIDGKTIVGDCSYLICYAYGVPQIGSSQIKEQSISCTNIDGKLFDGAVLWKQGHVGIYINGIVCHLKNISEGLKFERFSKNLGFTHILKFKNLESNCIKQWCYKGKEASYMIKSDGNILIEGFYKLGNEWYYQHPNRHGLSTGFNEINGNTYFFYDSFNMATGWSWINDKWFFFWEDGRACSGLQKLDDVLYYFNNQGMMQENCSLSDDSGIYVFDKNGRAVIFFDTILNVIYVAGNEGKEWLTITM